MKPCKCCEETREGIADALKKTLERYRNPYDEGALEYTVREGVDAALREFWFALSVAWYGEMERETKK